MAESLDHVTALNIFPIKSCHAATVDGLPPASLKVGPTGFQAHDVRDRDFVVVEAEPGDTGAHLFASQRGWGENGRLAHKHDSKLAAVKVDIRPDHMEISSEVGSIAVPTMYEQNLPKRDVVIHGKVLAEALDLGNEAAEFFSAIHNRPMRLVRANRERPRSLTETYHRSDAVNQVAAADSHPFLMVSEASLDKSHSDNDLAFDTVPIDRYRGNIVIDGNNLGPYGEDYIRVIKLGNLVAYVTKACARCPIPNIDQETGIISGGGLKVLRGRSGYRTNPAERDVFFGQNLNHVYVPGTVVKTGDAVEVLEMAQEPNVHVTAS